MSTRSITPTVATPVPLLTPTHGTVLQRTCDCGQHTVGGAECEECKKNKGAALQRHSDGVVGPAFAPSIVHEVLGSPGEPLDREARAFFEPRFGQDFSRVRVHQDAKAGESARSVHALAYAVGNNLVFGVGQYAPGTSGGKRLLAHELTHVTQQQDGQTPAVQRQLEVGPSDDRFEREADRMANQITRGAEDSRQASLDSLTPKSPVRLQRATAESAAAAAEPKSADTRTGMPLLVEDDQETVQAGQMRKGEFLNKLQISVCTAADQELKAVGQTTQACPYLARWMNHLRMKESSFVERGLRKYVPEAAGATKAEAYIAPVTARVRRGVARWAKSGEITEVPDELKGQLFAANIVGALESTVSKIGSAIGRAASVVAGGVKKAASAIGGLFAKEREGGLRESANPGAIRAQLGPGHPLDGGVKSRMESAFGGDFSQVRFHTDSTAASLSTQLNARAFTIGRDVAFGAGEYQPGTVIGDALIAHELAHVMQQTGPSLNRMSVKSPEYNALETDADTSAVNALASIWGGAKGMLARTSETAMPRLKSGLGLSRCSKGGGGPCSVAETQTITAAKQTAAGWVTTTLGKLRTTPVPAAVSASLQTNFGATNGVAANIPSIITKITTANTEMTTVPVSCAGTDDSTCAKAPCGYTPSAGGHAYVMCRNTTFAPGADPIYQAGCVLHEAFHSAFSDFTGDSYSGWGGHSGSTSGYPGSSPLKNADSYTSLVIDLK